MASESSYHTIIAPLSLTVATSGGRYHYQSTIKPSRFSVRSDHERATTKQTTCTAPTFDTIIYLSKLWQCPITNGYLICLIVTSMDGALLVVEGGGGGETLVNPTVSWCIIRILLSLCRWRFLPEARINTKHFIRCVSVVLFVFSPYFSCWRT